MNHRRSYEMKCAGTQTECVTILHRYGLDNFQTFVELVQELQCFVRGDNRRVRVSLYKGGHRTGMVRFHMLDYEIVRSAVPNSRLHLQHPLFSLSGVDTIHHSHLVVKDNIAVVAHSFRRDILTLKKIHFRVITPDIFYVVFHNPGFSIISTNLLKKI